MVGGETKGDRILYSNEDSGFPNKGLHVVVLNINTLSQKSGHKQ